MLQVVGRDASVEPLFVRDGAFGLILTHGEVERVGGDERIARSGQVRVHARPAIVFRCVDHGGANRVELDVAHNCQQVAFALH